MSTDDLAETTFPQRIVLLALAELTSRDETPANPVTVQDTATTRLDDADDVVSDLSEATVSRTLNELEADGLIDKHAADTSPVGKGRPQYSLSVDAATVVSAFRNDDRLATVADALDV